MIRSLSDPPFQEPGEWAWAFAYWRSPNRFRWIWWACLVNSQHPKLVPSFTMFKYLLPAPFPERFWFRGSGTRPVILHFPYTLGWCWCCRSVDHILNSRAPNHDLALWFLLGWWGPELRGPFNQEMILRASACFSSWTFKKSHTPNYLETLAYTSEIRKP